MDFLESLIYKTAKKIVDPLIDVAASQLTKQVKESGIIEHTVDDIANTVTNSTKFSKIMKCEYCNSEYDNTLMNCPNCGAVNENRKYDYQNE